MSVKLVDSLRHRLIGFLSKSDADALYQALSVIDGKGELIVGSADNTTDNLAIGSNGLALVMDSAETLGMKWAAVGRLLGLKSYKPTDTSPTTTSTSFVDVDATNLVVTFTAPASGIVLVRLEAASNQQTSGNHYWGLRDGSGDVAGTQAAICGVLGAFSRTPATMRVSGLTPGTSYTWKWAWKVSSGTAGLFYGTGSGPATIEVWEVAA